MNKKSKIFIIFSIILIFVISILYIGFFYKNDYTFELNSENKYRIETDMQWSTMQNDGGSHTNIYYNIDFGNNVISKISESYQANLGGKSKTTIKEIYNKELNINLQKELKSLLVEVMLKEDVNDTENYHPFIISTLNNEKSVYNLNTIEKINNILKVIDKS